MLALDAPRRDRRPAGRVLVALGLGLWLALLPPGAAPEGQGDASIVLRDDFSLETLDDSKWQRTRQNDFETEAVELVGGRLRMAASTLGTDDRTVKFHGVRTKEPLVALTGRAEISFELDWNDQANGCYMTVGAYLCPVAAENPREEGSWLRLLYIGVPPGRNARCLVSAKVAGHEKRLLTENWPQERTGRKIGRQRVQIALDGDSLVVTENGGKLLEADDLRLDFEQAYLYLQHSTHSNYPLRDVFFDDVVVRTWAAD